jgi:oligoendopeptidase F
MDYKGYNIAVHEFGHNVEQTIDLYQIDHYALRGVPNTGFTEALAFIFQKRDLQLLGYDQAIDDNTTLDIFWGLYEIMGVSLVDMRMWQWLYAHPDATAEELKSATISIAKEIWNLYYAPVLGEKDSPILACYSHMVNSPMYLPNYPLGHIVEFQLEKHFTKYKSPQEFAQEMKRIYQLGRLTPNQWMKQAVGSNLSIQPILDAVEKILKK